MMPPLRTHPSVQSFYQREVSQPKKQLPVSPETAPGDGFTEEELSSALDPLNRKWEPEREYEESEIEDLIPGPRAVTFSGRVVNVSTIWGRTPKQPKAAGWHYVILKSDTAAISVKLYFARTEYPLRLGHLISVWTAFIADASKASSTMIPHVTVCANLFPGRVTSDHIIIHTNMSSDSICRTPLGYHHGQALPGLMTLDSYTTSGHDGVVGARILVCVKSIGARKKITMKTGAERELVEVWVFDHTAEIKWTLWGELIASAKEWQPGKTTLLISNPAYRVEYSGKGSVGVQHSTMIDVDPEFPDALWLGKYALGLTKRESLCVEFPEGVWDVEAAEYGVYRNLYTLAEVDEWVRSNPRRIFTGHINITIMEISLVLLHRRHMLLCTECCGIPIYANTPTAPCPNCSKSLHLHANPKIIGMLLDETGCIAAGKLLWSERAWEQLLGRPVAALAGMAIEEIRWLEQRMGFLRMHMVFGWDERVGRLAVLGMRM